LSIYSEVKDVLIQTLRYRSVVAKLSRSDFYKLQMISEAINENVDVEYEVTPDLIAAKVLETFIQESFEDSTNRIVKRVIPEARIRKRH
jgi:hypothetical protein